MLRLLAVRVTTSGSGEPRESLEQMQAAIFGSPNIVFTPNSRTTLVEQFYAMSHGQLQYTAASAPTIATDTPGLVSIHIDTDILNGTDQMFRDVWPKMQSELSNVIGSSWELVADRFVFCLPDGALDDGVWAVGGRGGSVRISASRAVMVVVIGAVSH
jgi:hypothetical protein